MASGPYSPLAIFSQQRRFVSIGRSNLKLSWSGKSTKSFTTFQRTTTKRNSIVTRILKATLAVLCKQVCLYVCLSVMCVGVADSITTNYCTRFLLQILKKQFLSRTKNYHRELQKYEWRWQIFKHSWVFAIAIHFQSNNFFKHWQSKYLINILPKYLYYHDLNF